MNEYEFLRWEIGEGGVATVWLNRPPVNAINQPMYEEIQGLFGELGADPEINAIVLAGDGRHFCAGNELAEFETDDAGERRASGCATSARPSGRSTTARSR